MEEILKSLLTMVDTVLNQDIGEEKKKLLTEIKTELKAMMEQEFTIEMVMELNTKLLDIKNRLNTAEGM